MQISQVVLTVVFEADSFSFLPQLLLCTNNSGENQEGVHAREDIIAMSNAHRHEQTGQAAAPVLSYAVGGMAAPIHARGPGKDWDPTTRKEGPLLNPSELPQRKTDWSIIIFRRLSLSDTSRSDTGVLNFPT